MARYQCLTLLVTFCITMRDIAIAEDLKLQFLTGVPRFNSSTGYTDYYVCCNVIGRFLRWQVRTDRLAGFGVTDTSRVIVDTRSTYEYTATLLSSQPLPDSNQHQMDSVIVVTFVGEPPSEFQVTCTSETNSSTIPVVGNTSTVELANSSDHNEVVLDYILTRPIVQNKEFTHIFVCKTRDVQQQYELEDSRIGFNAQDGVGQARPVWSSDGYTVTILGVLVARLPYRSASIIFISENSEVTVTCFDGNHRAEITSYSDPSTTPMPSTTSPPSTAHLPMNPTSSQQPEIPVSSLSSPTPPMLDDPVDTTSSRPSYTLGPDVILNDTDVTVIVPVLLISLLLLVLGIFCAAFISWYRCCSRSPKNGVAVIAQEKGLQGNLRDEIVTGTGIGCTIWCSQIRDQESIPNDKDEGCDCGTETKTLLPFVSPANSVQVSDKQEQLELISSIDAPKVIPADFVGMDEKDSLREKFFDEQDKEGPDELFIAVEETRSVEEKSGHCEVIVQDNVDTDMEKEEIELNEAIDHSPGIAETPAEEQYNNAKQPYEQIDEAEKEWVAPLPPDMPYPAYQDFSCEQKQEDKSTSPIQHVLHNKVEDNDAAQPCPSSDTEVSSYEDASSLPYFGQKSDDTVFPKEKRYPLSPCDSVLNKEHSRRSRKVCSNKGAKNPSRKCTKGHSERSRKDQPRQGGKSRHSKENTWIWSLSPLSDQVKQRRHHFTATKLVVKTAVVSQAKNTRATSYLIKQCGLHNIAGLKLPYLQIKCFRNCWDTLQNGSQQYLGLEKVMHRLCEAYCALLDCV